MRRESAVKCGFKQIDRSCFGIYQWKKAVADHKNIIKDDKLCKKIEGVCSHLLIRWKSNVVMWSHEWFLTKNKACLNSTFTIILISCY